ncbi:PspC domain-containing protein [bacterium]|nr:MAG: PspC domain-containing protein [bacterium]
MIFVPVNPAHAHLKDEEKTRRNPAILWGAILIFLGFFLLIGHRNLHFPLIFPNHFYAFPWWGFPWERVWPLGLVILGVIYIIVVLQRDKRDGNQKAKEKKSAETTQDRKLYRTADDKVLGGVCGGIARYFNVDSTLIRIGLVLLAFITNVVIWIFVYVLFLIIVPYATVEKADSAS